MTGLFYHFRARDPHNGWRIHNKYISIQSYHHGFIDTTLSFLPYHVNIQILDSYNGFLLCHLSGSVPFNVFVCNPVARSWTLLPNLKFPNFYSLFLAFDPKVSLHFNFVQLQLDRGSPCVEFEKFSSQPRIWTKTQVFTEPTFSILRWHHLVYFNGIIYIVSARKHIVAIDLESMVCRRIEMPLTTLVMGNGLLGKSGGSLHYALKEKRGMKVWMLKDYERGDWVLKHIVELKVEFVVLHPDMDILFRRIQFKLLAYQLNNGELK